MLACDRRRSRRRTARRRTSRPARKAAVPSFTVVVHGQGELASGRFGRGTRTRRRPVSSTPNGSAGSAARSPGPRSARRAKPDEIAANARPSPLARLPPRLSFRRVPRGWPRGPRPSLDRTARLEMVRRSGAPAALGARLVATNQARSLEIQRSASPEKTASAHQLACRCCGRVAAFPDGPGAAAVTWPRVAATRHVLKAKNASLSRCRRSSQASRSATASSWCARRKSSSTRWQRTRRRPAESPHASAHRAVKPGHCASDHRQQDDVGVRHHLAIEGEHHVTQRWRSGHQDLVPLTQGISMVNAVDCPGEDSTRSSPPWSDDDVVAQPEPESRSLAWGLRREERLEYVLTGLEWYSHSIVSHHDTKALAGHRVQ